MMKKILLMLSVLLIITTTSYAMHGDPGRAMSASDKNLFCSICQETSDENTKIVVPLCRHKFHKECLAQWLTTNFKCPNCRALITINNLALTEIEKDQIIKAHWLYQEQLRREQSAEYAAEAEQTEEEPITHAQRLFIACENGNLVEIQRLLAADHAIIYAVDDEDKTGLYIAVDNGQTGAAALLLAAGATDNSFEELLSIAIQNGIVPLIKLLLPRVENINTVLNEEDGFTALHIAVGAAYTPAYIEVVRFLLDSGATISNRDKRGLTALDWAKHNENHDISELLLDRFVKVFFRSPEEVNQTTCTEQP